MTLYKNAKRRILLISPLKKVLQYLREDEIEVKVIKFELVCFKIRF